MSTIAADLEGTEYTNTALCPSDAAGTPFDEATFCGEHAVTLTTIACNPPATVTAAAITVPGDVTYFRPDTTSTTYSWPADEWTISPAKCSGYMTKELDAGDAAFAEVLTNLQSDEGPGFNLVGSAKAEDWKALYHRTITLTVYAKTAMSQRVTTSGTYATRNIYIADPACDTMTITQTSATGTDYYEMAENGSSATHAIPAPATVSDAQCPYSIRVLATSATTNSDVYPSIIELTAAAIFKADNGYTTYVSFKTVGSAHDEAATRAKMGIHVITFEWLNQKGDTISGGDQYELTVTLGHEDCKTDSAVPMTVT